MKKIISAVLTVSMILGSATVAFAQPKEKTTRFSASAAVRKDGAKPEASKKEEARNSPAVKADERKAQPGKRDAEIKKQIENVKAQLIRKCDEMLAQINKLKGYIISKDGRFIVEFKDQASGDAALKSIKDAIEKIDGFKKRIEAATTSNQLRDISKELQNHWIKHQTIMKRITGLASTARLKKAYDETKALVDKLGAGLEAITGSSITLDAASLKAEHKKIEVRLEEARQNYLEAVALFSSVSDSTAKNDKSFKAAEEKLMEAKKELQQVLVQTKRLLVRIREGIHNRFDRAKPDDDDDDNDDDEDDNDDAATTTSPAGITSGSSVTQ